ARTNGSENRFKRLWHREELLLLWTERLRKLSARHGTSGTDLSRANLRSAGRSSPAPIGGEISTGRGKHPCLAMPFSFWIMLSFGWGQRISGRVELSRRSAGF